VGLGQHCHCFFSYVGIIYVVLLNTYPVSHFSHFPRTSDNGGRQKVRTRDFSWTKHLTLLLLGYGTVGTTVSTSVALTVVTGAWIRSEDCNARTCCWLKYDGTLTCNVSFLDWTYGTTVGLNWRASPRIADSHKGRFSSLGVWRKD
jgi:hypothetical protein